VSDPSPAAGPGRLDWVTVGVGALADLAVMVPVILVYEILRGTGVVTSGTGDVGVIVTALVAAVGAPLVGGVVAGRRRPRTPLTHGAAAAGGAAVAYLVFRLVDAAVRGTSLHLASLVTFVIVSVTLGLVGGFIGFRAARTEPAA